MAGKLRVVHVGGIYAVTDGGGMSATMFFNDAATTLDEAIAIYWRRKRAEKAQ